MEKVLSWMIKQREVEKQRSLAGLPRQEGSHGENLGLVPIQSSLLGIKKQQQQGSSPSGSNFFAETLYPSKHSQTNTRKDEGKRVPNIADT